MGDVSFTIFKVFVGFPLTKSVREISHLEILSVSSTPYISSLFFSIVVGKIETRHIAIIFNREMASNRNKLEVLSLEERFRVDELHQGGKSSRKIADELGVGKIFV